MARSRGTGLKRKGPQGDGTRKAWPLLFSASSHPLRFIPNPSLAVREVRVVGRY